MHRPAHSRPRPAFTLVELLVVMAIIAVLAALLVGAVILVMDKGYDSKDLNDIRQLEIALNSFKKDHGQVYPPSKLVLYASYDDYFKNLNGDPQLDKDSLIAINRVWPNIGKFTYINWASTVNPAPPGFPAKGVILEGDQCLVFWLGGVYDPTQSGMMGFSTNPKNPAMDNATLERKKYYEFPAGRLNASKNASFPSYMDNYAQMPFLYFAPGMVGTSTPNAYNTNHAVTITYSDGLSPVSDVVSPYYQQLAAKKYWNASTFQIVTAGKDGRFGPLGEWNDGASPAANGTFWRDNRTNWSAKILGAVAQ